MGENLLLRLADAERLVFRILGLFLLSSFLLVSFGCDDNNNSGDSGEPSQADIDTTPPNFIENPVITMGPNPDTPLSGLLELETDEQTRVSVTIAQAATVNSSLTRGFSEPAIIEFEEFSTDHSLPLLGFTPDDTFTIEITITDESLNKTVFDEQLLITTDPLPEGFPPIDVTSSPEMMEPGITIFPVNGRGANAGNNFIISVNEYGEVNWYHKVQQSGVGDVRRLSNGNLMFIQTPQRVRMVEIDMIGNITQTWDTRKSSVLDENTIVVDTDHFHHEVFEMINGNLLVLSVEIVEFDNYPTSDSDPFAPTETASVAGDTIVEFTSDGSIVNEWFILDMLDPFRIGYQSLIGFWDPRYPEFEFGTRDWSHGNAVIHDPSDDSIIVSLRHQDAIIKFDRPTGQLIWILGPHENWSQEVFGDLLLDPIGENFLWHYHPHAPQVTEDGTILLFDNGNFRASPFDEKLPATENFSRAVEYSVNEETMEIEQVWEYSGSEDESIYAPFVGDADSLPLTGNVLINFGGIIKDELGDPSDNVGTGKGSIRIIEVTHTVPAEKVFDLSIEDDSPEVIDGWQSYRAERLPSLYPSQ